MYPKSAGLNQESFYTEESLCYGQFGLRSSQKETIDYFLERFPQNYDLSKWFVILVEFDFSDEEAKNLIKDLFLNAFRFCPLDSLSGKIISFEEPSIYYP